MGALRAGDPGATIGDEGVNALLCRLNESRWTSCPDSVLMVTFDALPLPGMNGGAFRSMVGARGPVNTEGVVGGDVALLNGLVCIWGEGVECGG